MRNLLLMGGAVMAGLMLYAVVVHQICTWRGTTHLDSNIEWVESRVALLGITGFWGSRAAYAAGYDTNYGLSMSLPPLVMLLAPAAWYAAGLGHTRNTTGAKEIVI